MEQSNLSLAARLVGAQLLDNTEVGLDDLDLVTIILGYCDARLAAQPTAMTLLAEFGTLGGILAAQPERLAEHSGMTRRAAAYLKFLQLVRERLLREPLREGSDAVPINDIAAYLRARFAATPVEEFRVVYLNSRYALLADEVAARGSVNRCGIYPDVVLRRTLELRASAIVLAHNHPSGSAEPSPDDIEVTRRFAAACALFDIELCDHIIVAGDTHVSMRRRGLVRTRRDDTLATKFRTLQEPDPTVWPPALADA